MKSPRIISDYVKTVWRQLLLNIVVIATLPFLNASLRADFELHVVMWAIPLSLILVTVLITPALVWYWVLSVREEAQKANISVEQYIHMEQYREFLRREAPKHFRSKRRIF